MDRELRIIYMGTPEFAVEPLRAILSAGYNVVAIITAPDKPAGRGQKIHSSPVKDFASKMGIAVLQPTNLKSPEFISELKRYNANLQVVVAFRMLPEIVWQMPEYGTLNLHASLLPQYRGAAPINHAIINGETETGLTTFFIEKEIDTGKIILARKIPILISDDAGTLHDKLMGEGGEVMVETLKMIASGVVNPQSQDESFFAYGRKIYQAPKIFKNDCLIKWDLKSKDIFNFVRGLTPFPGAYTNVVFENRDKRQMKIFKTSYELLETNKLPGEIISDNKTYLKVTSLDGIISIEDVQMEGKRRMSISEFLRGTSIQERLHMEGI